MHATNPRRLVSHRAVIALLLAAGSAAPAVAQQTNWTAGNAFWNTAANWNNAVPVAGGTAVIDSGAATLNVNTPALNALVVGSANAQTGGFIIPATFTLSVVNGFLGSDAGAATNGVGIINLGTTGNGARINATGSFYVGIAGRGFVSLDRDARLEVTNTLAIGNNDNSAGTNGGNVTLQNANARVRAGTLDIGIGAKARGRLNIQSGDVQANAINVGTVVSTVGGNAFTNPNGRIFMGAADDSTLGFATTFVVGATDAGSRSQVVLNSGLGGAVRIVGRNADGSDAANSLLQVWGHATATTGANSSQNYVVGGATFDTKVQFISHVVPGLGVSRMRVDLPRGMLRASNALVLNQGLTTTNTAATAGATTAFSNLTLAGSQYRVRWASDAFAGDLQFNADDAAAAALEARVSVPFSAAAAAGVPANVANRVRTWQLGATLNRGINYTNANNTNSGDQGRIIRNVSPYDPANLNTGAQLGGANPEAYAVTRNIQSDFELALGGQLMGTAHQDERIRALHLRGLTGSGIVLGQVEPGLPYYAHGFLDDWSSNNANSTRVQYVNGLTGLGQPNLAATPTDNGGAFFTYSGHTNRVASIMVGEDQMGFQVDGQSRLEIDPARQINQGRGFRGVAHQGRLITASTSGPENLGDNAFASVAAAGAKVINLSFGQGPATAEGTSPLALSIDFWARARGIVVTKSAGNSGPGPGTVTEPGGAYNLIVVGNAQFTADINNPTNFSHVGFWEVRPASSRGPVPGSTRSRPDLVAPGTGIYSAYMMEVDDTPPGAGAAPVELIEQAYPVHTNRGLYSTRQRIDSASDTQVRGTSFAAPYVAGVAGLMVQRAQTIGTVAGQNPLVIKSILQTSADKDVGRWGQGDVTSPAAYGSTITTPLSYTWGAGFADPVGAVDLLNRGQKAHGAAAINTDGWNLATLKTADSDNLQGMGDGHWYFFPNLAINSTITATLNWNRQVTASILGVGLPDGVATVSPLNALAYTAGTLTDLDLELWYFGALGAAALPGELAGVGFEPQGFVPELAFSSASNVDNLEHVFVNKLPQAGNYALRVFFGSGPRPDELYGVSWSFAQVPSSSAASVLVLLGVVSVRRRRMA